MNKPWTDVTVSEHGDHTCNFVSFTIDFTVEPVHNDHRADRRKWPLWMRIEESGHGGEVAISWRFDCICVE